MSPLRLFPQEATPYPRVSWLSMVPPRLLLRLRAVSYTHLVAKGARKPGGRLAARCELFCTVDLLLARGRSLDIVSQAELLEAPLGAGPDYARLMAARAVAEVAKRCSFEDEMCIRDRGTPESS